MHVADERVSIFINVDVGAEIHTAHRTINDLDRWILQVLRPCLLAGLLRVIEHRLIAKHSGVIYGLTTRNHLSSCWIGVGIWKFIDTHSTGWLQRVCSSHRVQLACRVGKVMSATQLTGLGKSIRTNHVAWQISAEG